MFETVQAKSLIDESPDELPALCYYRRTAVGHTVRMVAAGDIGLCGRAHKTGESLGFQAIFRELTPVISSADIAFANLEGPIVLPGGTLSQFAGNPEGIHAVADAGFTVLSLANNHIADSGPPGIIDTLNQVATHKMLSVGAGIDYPDSMRLVRANTRGISIGWLATARTGKRQVTNTPCFWELDEAKLVHAIQQFRPHVDVLIVSLHMGTM